MLFRKKRLEETSFLKGGQEIVDCVDLLYKPLDQLYVVANKTTELILLVQKRDLKEIKLPEELKNSLNSLRKLIGTLTSRCC